MRSVTAARTRLSWRHKRLTIMLSTFSTIRCEVAAAAVGLLGLAAHFVPALAAVDPLWIDLGPAA